MIEATSRQNWKIFCDTGLDVRECGFSKEDASDIIQKINEGKLESMVDLMLSLGAVVKKEPPKKQGVKKGSHKELWDKAVEAGKQAAEAHTPTPMIVEQRSHVLDDDSPVIQSWYVEGGECGYAWISVKPATSSFARWVKAQGLGRGDSYYGGLRIWVDGYGQSRERKEKYALAFAGVLRDAGLHARGLSAPD